MLEALENNPTVRERVLGLTAIGAILIGGAAGVDTMLTSGWQVGDIESAPTIYGAAQPQYRDGRNQDWSVATPHTVQPTAQTRMSTSDLADTRGESRGAINRTTTAAPSAPSPTQQATIADSQTDDDRQSASDHGFEAIENDVGQATVAIDPNALKDEPSPSPSPSNPG
ncbi:MAG: hypothetical protein HY054_04235 [Proteobacteria bacterium]|nr:hypothetical protein [Pseudomonadota bacterium]